ncbi:hypothetical protein [Streptococcus anginosus]|uniref:Uncharacterized protein n=1 Tax=Streptococcus anginosus subsp. whileyi CCUG 39159 TaxID=1095729 RepID=I0S8X1_STRAP|nr:hypothetical protein [Streptococcus anginosus]EID19824.1 hypothetical protein HMPREF1043_0896 [Streptococcus anginosus subsp. whileyi CCUG 39159]QQT08982.1 hypothetical protein I6J12_10995 [Streptococcus anginosus]
MENERKTYYVSGQAAKHALSLDETIDIGYETEAQNEYMAAVNFYLFMSSFCSGDRSILVIEVEEIKNDK